MHKLIPLFKHFSFRKPTPFLLKKSQVVLKELFVAKTIFELGTGLMFRKLKKHQGILFLMPKKQMLSLHMFCVFHPIDVLFCLSSTKGLTVVDKKPFFKPFSTYKAKQEADCFLELPAGSTKSVHVNDFISFPPKAF